MPLTTAPTPTALHNLRALLESSATDQPELLTTFDNLTTTIAAQSLLIRNLAAQARNSAVSQAQLDAALGRDALDQLLTTLGRPATTTFTLAEAESAARDLATTLSRGRETAAFLTAIARIAALFV